MGYSAHDHDHDGDVCAICHTAAAAIAVAVTTPCSHVFCIGCLEQWLSRAEENGCPNCRADVGYYQVHCAAKHIRPGDCVVSIDVAASRLWVVVGLDENTPEGRMPKWLVTGILTHDPGREPSTLADDMDRLAVSGKSNARPRGWWKERPRPPLER